MRLPVATLALGAVTAVTSAAISLTHRDQWAMFAMGVIPQRLDGPTPTGFGMLPAIVTPLSATLVHTDYTHLLTNLILLLAAGTLTERAMGWRGLLIVYAAGAYAAGLGQWVLAPSGLNPMVGASGAIGACIGAQTALYGPIRARRIGALAPRSVQIGWQIFAWALLNLGMAVVAWEKGYPIAWGAHIGGFIPGILMARPLQFIRLRGARVRRKPPRARQPG